MITVCFELTMPNKGSWNGKWTGEDRKYYKIEKMSERYLKSKEHFKQFLETGRDSFYYNWNDGWGANVIMTRIDATEAKKRRKISAGFAGYDWMLDGIKWYGQIMNSSEIKKAAVTLPIQ